VALRLQGKRSRPESVNNAKDAQEVDVNGKQLIVAMCRRASVQLHPELEPPWAQTSTIALGYPHRATSMDAPEAISPERDQRVRRALAIEARGGSVESGRAGA